MSRFNRKLLIPVVAISALTITGCAVTPKPFTKAEMQEVNRSDMQSTAGQVPKVERPITINDAIARALKYNLDHRVRVMEETLSNSALEAANYDMLPKLAAKAGYSWRNNDASRKSLNPDTGDVIENSFISSERTHTAYDLGLSWSLLDFGASYYSAQQNADQLLIAVEQRRKTMHTVVQKVRTAFWQAVTAEKLSARAKAVVNDAENALNDSVKVAKSGVKSPQESLRYQRNLLENLRLLEDVRREMVTARIELTSLMGLLPGTPYELVEPEQTVAENALDMDVQAMEEQALLNNADLRKQFYSARIAATEARSALLKLMPGLSLNYTPKYDDDMLLNNNRWREAGATVSFNLFNLLSGPARMKAAEQGKDLAQMRRVALQMAVLTQVHLANHQYHEAIRQFKRTDQIFTVDEALAQVAANSQQSNMGSAQDKISSDVTFILSSVRRYQAIAKIYEALSRLQATVGLEPDIQGLDKLSLNELTRQVEMAMNQSKN